MAHRRCHHGTTAVILLLLAGCATPGNTPIDGGSATPTVAHPTTNPTRTPAAPPTPGATSCHTAPMQVAVTVHLDATPAPICLRAHGEIRLLAPISPAQPWQPITTSDTRILHCQTTRHPDRSASAICTATGTGTATITIQTGQPADPHGPLQYVWTVPVTITN